MPPGLQGFLSSGDELSLQKRKLEHYHALIEQKFEKGLEYQISDTLLSEIIGITIDIKDMVSSDTEIFQANFELRTKCSAALSLFTQPSYREIYIEKLHTIRAALSYLISLF